MLIGASTLKYVSMKKFPFTELGWYLKGLFGYVKACLVFCQQKRTYLDEEIRPTSGDIQEERLRLE